MLIEPLTRAQCQTGYVFGSRFELEEDTIWVGLNSLAMGDLMFCEFEFAQGSHVGLLLQYEAAFSSELLSLHNPLPRGLQHVEVIIDDLVDFGQLLLQDLADLQEKNQPTWGSQRWLLLAKLMQLKG